MNDADHKRQELEHIDRDALYALLDEYGDEYTDRYDNQSPVKIQYAIARFKAVRAARIYRSRRADEQIKRQCLAEQARRREKRMQRLIQDAARAQEIYSLDELEKGASQCLRES